MIIVVVAVVVVGLLLLMNFLRLSTVIVEAVEEATRNRVALRLVRVSLDSSALCVCTYICVWWSVCQLDHPSTVCLVYVYARVTGTGA
jgi:hypothetical protein